MSVRPGTDYRPARARRRGWGFAALAAAVVVLVPVVVVGSSLLTPTAEVWEHLWATRLPRMLWSTVGLLVLTVVGTLVLGGGLAWLTSAYRFPGRRALSWMLVLPLAMPAYVLGFVYISQLGYAGPIQSAWRAVWGADAWFPEVRSLPVAAVVLTLTLYPYVYLLARSAVREQTVTTYEAARSLGVGPLQAARRVVLPLARPSLAAGAALVAMETLTDYATVQYFNVETVSVGVYRVWKGMFDRTAATELAALVLVFAVAVIAGERLLRGRARYYQQGGGSRRIEPVRLRGWRAWTATGVCSAVLAVTVFLPVLQLARWSSTSALLRAGGGLDPRYLDFLGHSLLLAGVTAVLCVAAALVLANAVRLNGDPTTRGAAQLATVGYAVPGPVIAVGVLIVLATIDRLLALGMGEQLLVTGSLAGVVYAYAVRFLALGYNSIDASFQKVTPSMTMSALALGAGPVRVLRRVHLPLIRSGATVALVLVAVDALKELPIVLLLRPFGFETLSIWVYQLASESRWELAGLPALTIVAVSAIPVGLLVGRERPDVAERRGTPLPEPREPRELVGAP